MVLCRIMSTSESRRAGKSRVITRRHARKPEILSIPYSKHVQQASSYKPDNDAIDNKLSNRVAQAQLTSVNVLYSDIDNNWLNDAPNTCLTETQNTIIHEQQQNQQLNVNYLFYTNQLACKPHGVFIDDLIDSLLGSYSVLENDHNYILIVF